ncbi:MAG TPA: glycoside hydrolase family 3 protein [Steroidobacteraceae bacterium]|jgi:beta-glucosidase
MSQTTPVRCFLRTLILVFCAAILLQGCTPKQTAQAQVKPAALPAVQWPHVTSTVKQDPQLEARVAALLRQLTLEQKIAQMVQPEIRYVTPADMRTYHFGSILNGGGAWPGNDKHAKAEDWVALADTFYNASMDTSAGAPAIPVIWGTDAVHGHSNVFGATLFPHNIGLGAAHDPDLIERIGQITALEVAVTGIDWTFAPTLAVVRDDRWGRTYEGYSEDPEIVRSYAGRMVRGLQGTGGTRTFLDSNHIVATAKHYIGDGGTDRGVDRGDNLASEQQLLDIHAQGYLAALAEGVQTVMASYNSWHGWKLHGSKYLLTDVLKTQMGFDGPVVSDWNGIDEVQGCSIDKCAQAVNAGVDLVMVPEDWKTFIANTLEQVRAGDIPGSRVDDAVARILRLKLRAGLFEKGPPSTRPLANKRELLGAAIHRDVARQAVRESLVLLKNRNGLLPLARKLNVLVAGDGADNIGKQCGGWSLTWQGTQNTNADFPGATSIFAGIKAAVATGGGTAALSPAGTFTHKPDVAIVVFGEGPYAEYSGNIKSMGYQGSAGRDAELLARLKQAGIPVVAIFLSGRPLWVNPELNASDAFVAAWLPGSEGAGVAEVIFRNNDGTVNHDFTGKLSFSWPRRSEAMPLNRNDEHYDPLFAYGFGLTFQDADTLQDDLPVGVSQ